MKQLLLITILFCVFASGTFAQMNKEWHYNAGSVGQDAIECAVTDSAGNMYFAGSFRGTIDVDPSSSITYISTAVGHTETDAFIVKLDANSNFLWAKQFGSTGNNTDAIIDIAIDNSGFIYVLGYYTNEIQFIPNDTIWQGGTTNFTRPFLVKLDDQGNVLWGYGWKNNSEQLTNVYRLELDDWGNVYVLGFMIGTMDFDPTHNSTQIKTSTGALDAFFIKIKPTGIVQKVRLIGGTGSDIAYGIAIKGAEVFVVGQFQGSVNFSTNAAPDILTSNGSRNVFISKMDTGYNHLWAKAYGDSGQPTDVVISNSGRIYTIGMFLFSADFDPSSNTQTLASNGGYDAYLQILNANGDFIHAFNFGGSGDDRPTKISLSPNQNLLIVGKFRNTVDFDSGIQTASFISNGGDDAFVAKYDSNGAFIQAAQFGSSGTDRFNAAHFLDDNLVLAGGYFEGTIDIDPTQTVDNIVSAGARDFVVLKLKSCSFSYTAMQETACNSYTMPSGNAVYTNSGTYNDTIPSTRGCDSILTINLTILPALNATVTQTVNGLEANATGSGLSYEWLDCTTNQIITGANQQTFMPSANGNYAVIVTNSNCTDTSACYAINNVAINEAALANLNLYPNPTTGILRISSTEVWQKIEITDLLGRVVKTQNTSATEIDLSQLATGVYVVRVYFKDGISMQRVVKE